MFFHALIRAFIQYSQRLNSKAMQLNFILISAQISSLFRKMENSITQLTESSNIVLVKNIYVLQMLQMPIL